MKRTNAVKEITAQIPFLLGCATRLCRHDADARDLVQDTCLQAVLALKEGHAAPQDLRAWLVVVMRNHWFSTLRRQRVRMNAYAELAAVEREADDALCEARLVCSQLARAWSQLPAQSQTIAKRCLIDGDSQEDVSRKLGLTAGGVAASIHRTRHALRATAFSSARAASST
jgi:RNA polymerase sigma-70 factor (ECF subfamily)